MAVQEPVYAPEVSRPGLVLRIVQDQRVAFLLVGGVNTAIGFGWFVLFHLLASGVGYMGTLVLAHVCSVLCAFVLHRALVFRVRGHVLRDLARFEVVNLGALALNAAALPFCVEILGLPVLVSQVVATVFSVACTYVGHRTFSFRRPAVTREER